MDCDNKAGEVSTQRGFQNSQKIWPHIIILSFIFVNLLLSERHRHSFWTIALAILIFIFLISMISTVSPRLFVRLLHWTFGKIDYIQIISPEYEQRIRIRYQSEIGQLQKLGFDYLFSYGESFQLIRLLLLLPAVAVFGSWRNRETISIQQGMKFVTGFPVLISTNKNAYAHSFGLGVKFYTTFQDGTLLVSKDFADGDFPSGPMIIKYAQKASISDTWTAHQKRIAELEAKGKRVNHQTSFQAYAEISDKETAAW